ncbi:MAG: alpha-L-fucosidase [Bacteroidota bacterium]
MKYTITAFLFFLLVQISPSQENQQKYIAPTDSLVVKKLAQWSNLKFGLLMHWGAYSQWGIVESWSICPEDEEWCARKGVYSKDYSEYKKQYENLKTTFNPEKFNPEKWAAATAAAGMKYVVFTTKHHDGFCMFDTKQTNYKITDAACPFSKNEHADVTKEIFKAFRKQQFLIGAYFSKPDWHCPDYWNPYFPPMDRNPNYDIKKYPEKWNNYIKFTTNQIEELMKNYGKVDILWLDGGWVRPSMKGEKRNSRFDNNQDIGMSSIAKMCRTYQPGLIVVDRDVEGENQNYLTPEQSIPDKPLPFPWETCMTMATSWSWIKNDTYKSSEKIIQTLAKIVSRGGNLLLNIAPNANGELDSTAYVRLHDIGDWMKINGEAIYNTIPVAPYEYNNWVFTKNGNLIYAICLLQNETDQLPVSFDLPAFSTPIKSAEVLGNKNAKVQFKTKSTGLYSFQIPDSNKKVASHVLVVKIELSEK